MAPKEPLGQNTNLRGIRQTIPTGFLLGRKSAGNGPVELISASDLPGLGAPNVITTGNGNYTPEFVGGISTSINRRLSHEVWLDDLSSPLTTTDWGPVIHTALALALPKGGRCFLTPGSDYSILTSCTLPKGVTLQGQYNGIATVTDNSESADFSLWAAIKIASTATVSLKASSGIRGAVMYRSGMTFPASNSSAFAGTALTGIGDDCFIEDCVILGFAQAFISTNVNRVRVHEVNFDNQANIKIVGSLDTCYVSNVHAWPFTTHIASDTAARNKRTGTHFIIKDSNDWTKVSDSFCYGYDTGWTSDNSASVTFIGVSADNVNEDNWGTGFLIKGSTLSADNKLIACQAAAHENGFAFQHTGGNTHWMEGCSAWGIWNHGILIDTGVSGAVTIQGGIIRDALQAITVASASAIVSVDFVKFNAITNKPIVNVTTDTTKVYVGPNCEYGDTAAGEAASGVHSVSAALTPSAGTLALPLTGNVFAVSGDFADVTGGWKDREVTLLFTGTSVVTSTASSTISKVHLNGNTTKTFAASDTLTLRHFGSISWYEEARSTAASAGTVTSITAGTGLSGGTITGSGTIALANTAVTPATYTAANITVDAQGRITAAANSGSVSHTDNPGGLIFKVANTDFYVQWGIITVSSPGSGASVSFLTTFPNANYGIQLTPETGSTSYYPKGAVVSKTTSGFTADSDIASAFRYLAIGW